MARILSIWFYIGHTREMRNLVLLWVCWVILPHARAADLPDDLRDFIANLMSEQKRADPDFEYWSSRIYLFRFDLDVVGSDEPERFYGSSSLVDRSPVLWSIYRADSKKLVKRDIMLSVQGFYVDRRGDAVRLTYVWGKQNRVELTTTTFGRDTDPQEETKEFLGNDAWEIIERGVDWDQTLDLGEKFLDRDTEKVLLAESLRKPDVEWRPYFYGEAPDQQYLDPADRESLLACEGLLPSEVYEVVENGIPDPLEQTQDRPQAESGSSPPKPEKATAQPELADEGGESKGVGPLEFIALTMLLGASVCWAIVALSRRRIP